MDNAANAPFSAAPADGKAKKRMCFINVVPFFPAKVDYMVSEAKRLAKEVGLINPAYSMTLQPEGDEPLKKIRYFAEKFGELRKKLEGTSVRPGILIQSIMGHGWNGQTICGKNWHYTININGKTTYRMCPEEPEFLQYVREIFLALTPHRPAFFLTDDDLRLINNSTHGLECFCPLHMKLFNARSKRKFQPDELREYLMQAPSGDPVATLFDTIRQGSLLKLARLIRSSIDEAGGEDIPCGSCAGGREYMLMERFCKTLAGKNPPFLRIHNALYLEQRTLDFPMRMRHTNLMKKAAGDIPVLLDEADTCPHNRFSKSSMGMHTHITGGILNGLSGAKLWITNMAEPEASESARYERIIAQHRGFYDALLNLCDGIDWLGPRTVIPPKEYGWRPAHLSPYYLEWEDWQELYLNRFGIPGSYGDFDPKRVTLLCGSQARAMSKAELKRVLSGKVLIDGNAAFAIQEKGLGKLIGATPTHKEFRFACEIDQELGRTMPFQNDFSAPFFTRIKGKVLSELFYRPFRSSPEMTPVATGSIYFENEFGGKNIVTAVAMRNIIYNMLKPVRKLWLLTLLKRLDPALLPAYCSINQDTYFRCGITRNQEQIGAIINLSFDTLENPEIIFRKKPKKIFILNGNGAWKELKFSSKKDTITLDLTLGTYENMILKIES
ncbi:MAG: hypothetical protein IKO93_03780 [Lentisphaeria bacterium]|nr:hypothetical protein [Lentisphaeria bacterium]